MLDVECHLPWLQMQFMMQKRFATFQSSTLVAITWLLPTPELHVPFRLNTFRKFYATNGRFQWHLTRQPTFNKPLGLMFTFGTIKTLLWKTFHLITLPFAGRHTGLATFEMFEKLFDAICPLWKDKLIGCSTDGAANMTGHLSGVVIQI
jgi:hypothetical protein